MKPDEIKKALTICRFMNTCRKCPYNINSGKCLTNLTTDALAYIQELESAIKTLQMENNQLQDDIVNANGNYEQLKDDYELLKNALAQKIILEIKSEAIKEFAERLKELKKNSTMDRRIYTAEMIDSLVKEMVGENG